jgi:hypothetical protein
MPKEKMKFPDVPGETPRERFINLVRQVFSIPKAPRDKRIIKRKNRFKV